MHVGFPGDTTGKEPAYSAEYVRGAGFTPGSGRSPGGGHDNSFQYSCLENPMEKGAAHNVGRLESIV